MLTYYDERSAEYDEVYAGGLPGESVIAKEEYSPDADALLDVARRYCVGSLIDAPCGTAFWLPAYAPNVESVVLVDQSPHMLAQARAKERSAGIEARCSFLQQDVLEHPWPSRAFDTILCGFFLSHIDGPEEQRFFARVRVALRPRGTLVVFDSKWSTERAAAKPKAGVVRRTLNDGREFEIYKRYFDESDVAELAHRHGFRAELRYVGRPFLAFTGVFDS